MPDTLLVRSHPLRLAAGMLVLGAAIALPVHGADTTDQSAPHVAGAPITGPTHPDLISTTGRIAYGFDGWKIPDATGKNDTAPRTIELLIQALSRSDNTIIQRVVYVGDLGRTQSPQALPALQKVLADEAPQVRAQAATAIAQTDDPSSAPSLQTLLNDTDPRVRSAAIKALSSLNRSRTQKLTAVVDALRDTAPGVIATALACISTPDESAAALDQFQLFTPSLRSEAINAIGRVGTAEQAEKILPLIGQSLPQRIALINALGQLKATRQQPWLIEQLSHAHPTVRRQALLALNKVAPQQDHQTQAEALLGDPDASVRDAAAQGAAPVRSDATAHVLIKLLDDPHPPLHTAVLQALIHPANDAVRQTIITAVVPLLQSENPRRQEDASFILGYLHSNADLEAHLKLAQYTPAGDVDVITQAAQSLGLIGDQRAIPALLALSKYAKGGSMSSASEIPASIIANAMISLGQLNVDKVIADARRTLSGDPQFTPEVMMAAAAWAVGATAPTGDRSQLSTLKSILNNAGQAESTRAEAIKALVNLQFNSEVDTLRKLSQNDWSPLVAATAHWAAQALSGQTFDYTPPVHSFTPSVSITDWSSK